MFKQIFKFFDKNSVSELEWNFRISRFLSILSICISLIFWSIYILVKLYHRITSYNVCYTKLLRFFKNNLKEDNFYLKKGMTKIFRFGLAEGLKIDDRITTNKRNNFV